MPLLRVEHLKKYYPAPAPLFGPKRFVRALDDVSFELNEGETLGLVGESGCGKSTLARQLIRLENPTDGHIYLDDIDLGSLHGGKLRKMRGSFQMIFQDPMACLNPRQKVADIIGQGLDINHLAVNPRFIVADEPVSALDVSVQSQIVNLLQDIQKETKVAFLFIAHDLAVVEHISHRIMVMYLGRIAETGPARELCAHPAHPYTRALLSSVPTTRPEKRPERIVLTGDVPSPLDPPSGCRFHPRCPRCQPVCSREEPRLRPVDGCAGHCCACHFPFI